MQLKQFGKHFFNQEAAALARHDRSLQGTTWCSRPNYEGLGDDKAARRGWGVPDGFAVSEIQTAGDYCPWR